MAEITLSKSSDFSIRSSAHPHAQRESALHSLNTALGALVKSHGNMAGDSQAKGGTAEMSPQVAKSLAKVNKLLSHHSMEEDLAEINAKAEADEADAMAELLRTRLREKAKYDAVLTQGLESAKSSEMVLRSELEAEIRERETLESEVKALESAIESMRAEYKLAGRKEVGQVKEINRLELQIKDLQMTLEQTVDKERKAEITLVESSRKARELEKELIHARIANMRNHEANDTRHDELTELKDNLTSDFDKLAREGNAAKIKVIAMKKNYAETCADIDKLNDDLKDSDLELAKMRKTLQGDLRESNATKAELMARLQEEEAANQSLCKQLSEAAKTEMQLATHVKTVEAARNILSKELEQKTVLSMQLSARLGNLQDHHQELEGRLADKDASTLAMEKTMKLMQTDLNTLSNQLQKEEHNVHEQELQLTRESNNVKALEAEIAERQDRDHQMSVRVKEVEAITAVVRQSVNETKSETDAMTGEIMHCGDKCEQLQQQLSDVQVNLQDLQAKFRAKSDQYISLDKEIKDKVREFMVTEHETKLQILELKNAITEREDLNTALFNGLKLNEVKITDLQEMLENAAASAEQNKQSLRKRLQELTSAGQLLSEEIGEAKKTGKLRETELVNVEDRLRSSLASLGAQEKTAQGLSQVNQKDQERMMNRLSHITGKAEGLNEDLCMTRAELRKWARKLEDQKVERLRAEKHLKDERDVNFKLRASFEKANDHELEQNSKVKSLESHNADVEQQLKEQVALEQKYQLEYDEVASDCGVLKGELRDKELSNQGLGAEQHNNHEKIAALENEMGAQEKVHLADARAVKMSIISLQDALMQKVNMVETLVKTTQHTKTAAKALQERLQETEVAASESQRRYEDMLEEEQRTSARLKTTMEQKDRRERKLQAQLMRKGQEISTTEALLLESSNRSDILQSDADTKRKEADMMNEQLEKKTLRERDMMEAINNREDEMSSLRLQQRENDKRENDMRKALERATFQNRLLRAKVSEKMKAERYLYAELEAERLHVQEIKHPENHKAMESHLKSKKQIANVFAESDL